jgi:hypothetical protein
MDAERQNKWSAVPVLRGEGKLHFFHILRLSNSACGEWGALAPIGPAFDDSWPDEDKCKTCLKKRRRQLATPERLTP